MRAWGALSYKEGPASQAVLVMLDSDFSSFVTVRFVGLLYLLGLLALVVGAIPTFMGANGLLEQVGVIAAVPVAGLIWRMALEGVVVVFRIAENTSELVELRKRRVQHR